MKNILEGAIGAFIGLMVTVAVLGLVAHVGKGSATISSEIKKGYFGLIDGSRVMCESSKQENCGMTLEDCDSGVTYRCQHNVLEFRR